MKKVKILGLGSFSFLTLTSLILPLTISGCSDDDVSQSMTSDGNGDGDGDGDGDTGDGDSGDGDGDTGDGDGDTGDGDTGDGGDSGEESGYSIVTTPAGPTATKELTFTKLGALETFADAASEIVDFDASANFAYVTNSDDDQVDAFSIEANGTIGATKTTVDVKSDSETDIGSGKFGGINSLVIRQATGSNPAILAIAVENDDKQAAGWICFYELGSAGAATYIESVSVGSLPDMVTFTPDGSKVIVANEGEPNKEASVDPEGTVSVIAVPANYSSSETLAAAASINFNSFNDKRDELIAQGVRFSIVQGDPEVSSSFTVSTVSEDLEPEYVTATNDSAYVTLQENNALAVIDLSDNSVSAIVALGGKDHRLEENAFDPSDRDGENDESLIQFVTAPLEGLYQPDAISHYEAGGKTYLITANEGDAREYGDDFTFSVAGEGEKFFLSDEARYKDLKDIYESSEGLAEFKIPFYDDLSEDNQLGRLKVSTIPRTYDTTKCELSKTWVFDADEPEGFGFTVLKSKSGQTCELTSVDGFGARSFTIWSSAGEVVWDSGSDLEAITAAAYPDYFNASNDDNELDSRSDSKGPEPESVTIGEVGDETYVFVGLERISAIAVYQVSDPANPVFVELFDNRDFTKDEDALESDLSTVGDLGPEGLRFVSAAESPTGDALLIVANEITGTTRVWSIDQTTP